MATASVATVPVDACVSVGECERKHRAGRWLTLTLCGLLSVLVAVMVATAAVGWSARTAVAVREAELKGIRDRLDRIEDKLDALLRGP